MDELIFAGNKYISSKRASKLTGYTTDYIGQMCRGDKMDCRLVGRNWYVNEKSIIEQKKSFKKDLTSKITAGEIEYRKIELEPMHYSNDDRIINPDINKAPEFIENSASQVESEEIIPLRIVTQQESFINTCRPQNIIHRPNKKVVVRQSILPQINKRISIMKIFALGILFIGTLFTISTFTIEKTLHYSNIDKNRIISEFKLSNIVGIEILKQIGNIYTSFRRDI